MTPEEHILWHYLRNRNTLGFKFRDQQVIEGFIIDFYCHSVGLIIEVDGRIHRMQQNYDTERDRSFSHEDYMSLGSPMMTFTITFITPYP